MFYFLIMRTEIWRICEFHYIEGFTHYKSSYISLQLVNPHPKITLVNEPICFGNWFEFHSLQWDWHTEERVIIIWNCSMSEVRNTHLSRVHLNEYVVLEDISFHRGQWLIFMLRCSIYIPLPLRGYGA